VGRLLLLLFLNMLCHVILSDSFILQKSMEARSDSLYKKANPFAYQTMKDWVQTLSSLSNNVALDRLTPHQRHPWELDHKTLHTGEVIGRGSHGQVYRGLYKGADVAIKVIFHLDPMDTEDAEQRANEILSETAAEADALSGLRHINVMRFFGICFMPQQHSIAMVTELCESDLRKWIDGTGTTVKCVLHLGASFCSLTFITFR